MFESAHCRIMRIELQLLDFPSKLSEMRAKDREGKVRNLFTEEDDIAASRLEAVRTVKNSFLPYFKDFSALKEKFSFNVPEYGNFALTDEGFVILQEVEAFNSELLELRRKVNGMLSRKYIMSSWQHTHICRFNPRVKLGLYLLPKFFIEDKRFTTQIAKVFKEEIKSERMDVNWLLSSSQEHLLERKTIYMKKAKDELCANYLESRLVQLF